jgi:hypothetical protein
LFEQVWSYNIFPLSIPAPQKLPLGINKLFLNFLMMMGWVNLLWKIRNPHCFRFAIFFRKQLTKLRISSHPLAIETGRYSKPKTPHNERFCKFCKDQVEDKSHFLFNKKWDLSSTWSLQNLQNLSLCGVFGLEYLPVSIASGWVLILFC